MNRQINRSGVSIQRLAEHQDSFPMVVTGCAENGDGRGERGVARDFLPDEMKVVHAKPHILAASTYRVSVLGTVVLDGAGMKYSSNILLPRKDTKRPILTQGNIRSEEHTSELQSLRHLVCRLLLEKKNTEGRIQFLDQGRCRSLSTASRQHPHPIPESSVCFFF